MLKWVGGKRVQVARILEKLPRTIGTYWEPFVGGASVLLAVLDARKKNALQVERLVAADVNPYLIEFYCTVQRDPNALYAAIKQLFTSIEEPKVHYYACRERFNKLRGEVETSGFVERAALFFYLNRAGFRGMYRESRRGSCTAGFAGA